MQRLTAKFTGRVVRPTYDVFINHRGMDTKRTIGGLLFDHLSNMGLRPFLDKMTMKPGDRLFDHIKNGVAGSKVGVAIFSPRYCDSYFCLHEISLLMESQKRIIPLFYDVKPSQLLVKDNGTCTEEELQRFRSALDEARNTVGVTFDSSTGDWSELLSTTTNAILINLREVEEEIKKVQNDNEDEKSSYTTQ